MSAKPWPMTDVEGQTVDPPWELRREARSWVAGEAWKRYVLAPCKIEMVDGKLFGHQEGRELLLGLLLENVGADRAVQFGNLEIWRAAIASAHAPERGDI